MLFRYQKKYLPLEDTGPQVDATGMIFSYKLRLKRFCGRRMVFLSAVHKLHGYSVPSRSCLSTILI